MNVVAYIRASTGHQLLSPDMQTTAIQAWADKGQLVVTAWCEDAGVSSQSPIHKRPALIQALQLLGRGDLLVVAKWDRLSRSPGVAFTLEGLAAAGGWRVVSADGQGSDETPEGVFMRRILQAVSEYEVARIRDRTRAALAEKRAKGEKTGGAPPYGFKTRWEGLTKMLHPHPTEYPVLDEIVRLYREEELTIHQVVDRLNADQEAYPPRGVRWHPTTVRRILTRESSSEE